MHMHFAHEGRRDLGKMSEFMFTWFMMVIILISSELKFNLISGNLGTPNSDDSRSLNSLTDKLLAECTIPPVW